MPGLCHFQQSKIIITIIVIVTEPTSPAKRDKHSLSKQTNGDVKGTERNAVTGTVDIVARVCVPCFHF